MRAYRRALAQTEAAVAEVCNQLDRADIFGLDTESSGPGLVGLKGKRSMLNVYRSTLTGISVALPSGRSYYIPTNHRTGNAPVPAQRLLASCLAGHKGLAVIHNAKHEAQAMARDPHAVRVAARWTESARQGHDTGVRCTQVLAWLLASKASEKKPYGLKLQAKRFLGLEMSEFSTVVGERDFSALKPEEGLDYACEDAEAALGLYEFYSPKLKAFPGLEETYRDVEMPFVFVLRHMEESGMYLDPEKHRATLRGLQDELVRLEDEWEWLTPAAIGSAKQLQALYQDGTWDAQGLGQTVWGVSTTREAVEEQLYRCKPGSLGHRLAEIKNRHSVVGKLCSTYGESILDLAGQYDDMRLHPSFLHTGTDTGRLSCSYPNLQNIPKRTAEGKLIRNAFAPDYGRCFTSADYSQIELRVLAHFAKTGPLFEGYLRNEDVHQSTAEALGVTRDQGKTTNFAVVYGVGPRKLSKKVGMTFEECRDFMKRHREYHADAMNVLERAQKAGSKRGYVRTFLHRFRPIDSARWAETLQGLKDDGKTYNGSEEFRDAWFQKGKEDRRAGNTPIQGGAADIVKLAMLSMWRTLDLRQTRLVCQIHDDLIQEPTEGYAAEAAEIQQKCMEEAYKLRVPLVAEPSTAADWGSL